MQSLAPRSALPSGEKQEFAQRIPQFTHVPRQMLGDGESDHMGGFGHIV